MFSVIFHNYEQNRCQALALYSHSRPITGKSCIPKDIASQSPEAFRPGLSLVYTFKDRYLKSIKKNIHIRMLDKTAR